jgi:hypothetical protein
MNTDDHGLKRIFISPAARKKPLQTDAIVVQDSLPPPGGLN